ncbi:MAG: transposase, partial [Lachnospiraceae bacterium]|nr:transposase [Lachnospiraceae bacterium]
DNGWGMFVGFLEYKLRDRGKLLIRTGRYYASSQTCSCCGRIEPKVKDLKIRRWQCPACGAVHDRDINAAVNIRKEALRILNDIEIQKVS